MKSKRIALILPCLVAFFSFSCGSDGGGDALTIKGIVVGTKGSPAAKSGILAVSDHVYAVNSGYTAGCTARVLAPIENNAFSIVLPKCGSWVLVFIDSRKIGPAMIQGIFKAQDLDSIAPMSEGSASESEVGEVAVDPQSQTATLDQTHVGEFIKDLGYTASTADFFGALDDLMLRYVNPDVDGNGLIDMNDPSMPDYFFRYTVGYSWGNSALLTENLEKVRAGAPLSTGSAIVFISGYPYLSATKSDANALAFFQTKTQFKVTVTNAGGTVFQSKLRTVHDNGAEFGYGIDPSNDQFAPTAGKLPEGTYAFDFYNASAQKEATYTFSNVNTLDDVNDVSNFIFPFPVFQVDGTDTITAVDYHWMKSTPQGFVDAKPEELELLLGRFPTEIKWHTACPNPNDCGSWVLVNPSEYKYAITGSVPASRITGGELNTHKRSDIIEVTMTLSTKIGIGISLAVAM